MKIILIFCFQCLNLKTKSSSNKSCQKSCFRPTGTSHMYIITLFENRLVDSDVISCHKISHMKKIFGFIDLKYQYFLRFVTEEARNSDKGVLVHCLAGISRSVTVTVAYLMHKCNLSLNDAFTLVRDRKANIAPNFHFMEQLHSFENELRARGHRISGIEQRCIGACRQGGPCNCPQPSFINSADMGLSPDSGIEFDRWTGGTPAE